MLNVSGSIMFIMCACNIPVNILAAESFPILMFRGGPLDAMFVVVAAALLFVIFVSICSFIISSLIFFLIRHLYAEVLRFPVQLIHFFCCFFAFSPCVLGVPTF